jgi:hypothetical protein
MEETPPYKKIYTGDLSPLNLNDYENKERFQTKGDYG